MEEACSFLNRNFFGAAKIEKHQFKLALKMGEFVISYNEMFKGGADTGAVCQGSGSIFLFLCSALIND